MERLKTGDQVVVLAGKDRGKQGEIKPNPNTGTTGGILEKEMPIDGSNLALLNPATGKGEKVGFKILDDGRKVRVFKSNGEVVGA